VGGPTLPTSIPAGTACPAFTVSFDPSAVGAATDTLTATLAGGFTDTLLLQGIGSQITPAYILSGTNQSTLFGFSGAVLQADPDDFICEEASSLTKLHDFNQPNVEKQLARVRGHYLDAGPAAFTVVSTTRRQGEPDSVVSGQVVISAGAFNDQWPREFTADVENTGELIQLVLQVAAGAGAVLIMDYMPEFDTKGQVIGGT
jgi:hypothetical protein